ncbi:hypothetical protein [Microvirga sp. TS319]|uniref:hypothetical protein n=1 Tax=Microvirga sp. TS319 TaxID=3241165 RepID=UPI003519FE26
MAIEQGHAEAAFLPADLPHREHDRRGREFDDGVHFLHVDQAMGYGRADNRSILTVAGEGLDRPAEHLAGPR